MAIDSTALGKPLFGDDAFNIVKFALSIMSMGYDAIFMVQHFLLYSDSVIKDRENRKNLLVMNVEEKYKTK